MKPQRKQEKKISACEGASRAARSKRSSLKDDAISKMSVTRSRTPQFQGRQKSRAQVRTFSYITRSVMRCMNEMAASADVQERSLKGDDHKNHGESIGNLGDRISESVERSPEDIHMSVDDGNKPRSESMIDSNNGDRVLSEVDNASDTLHEGNSTCCGAHTYDQATFPLKNPSVAQQHTKDSISGAGDMTMQSSCGNRQIVCANCSKSTFDNAHANGGDMSLHVANMENVHAEDTNQGRLRGTTIVQSKLSSNWMSVVSSKVPGSSSIQQPKEMKYRPPNCGLMDVNKKAATQGFSPFGSVRNASTIVKSRHDSTKKRMFKPLNIKTQTGIQIKSEVTENVLSAAEVATTADNHVADHALHAKAPIVKKEESEEAERRTVHRFTPGRYTGRDVDLVAHRGIRRSALPDGRKRTRMLYRTYLEGRSPTRPRRRSVRGRNIFHRPLTRSITIFFRKMQDRMRDLAKFAGSIPNMVLTRSMMRFFSSEPIRRTTRALQAMYRRPSTGATSGRAQSRQNTTSGRQDTANARQVENVVNTEVSIRSSESPEAQRNTVTPRSPISCRNVSRYEKRNHTIQHGTATSFELQRQNVHNVTMESINSQNESNGTNVRAEKSKYFLRNLKN